MTAMAVATRLNPHYLVLAGLLLQQTLHTLVHFLICGCYDYKGLVALKFAYLRVITVKCASDKVETKI